MAQGDLNVANQSGAAFRSDLNNQLLALGTLMSGAAEPSTTYAYMRWVDTTNNIIKGRNAANNGWIPLRRTDGTLISTSLELLDSDGSNYVGFQAPTTASGNVKWTLPSGDGSSSQSLVTNGSAILSWESHSRIVSSAVKITTSGTSVDFTDIPSWAKRITLSMAGVSTNGTSLLVVRLGDSGGFETSGYLGTATFSNGVNVPPAPGIIAHSNGFNLIGGAASANSVDIYGALTFSLLDSSTNTWACSGNLSRTAELISMFVSGSKSLSATLDRIQITSVGGTDTFDAGKASIIYEG
jgi:hypothetical protein